MNGPALIGAGIGAGTSLLSGRDPLKGALLGGAGGGLYGSFQPGGYMSSLFSSAPASALPASTAGAMPFGSKEFISPFTKEGIVNFADGTTSTLSPDYLSAGAQYGANAPSYALDSSMLGKSAGYTGGGYGGGIFDNFAAANPYLTQVGGNVLSNQIMAGLTPQQQQPMQMIQPNIIPGKNAVAGRVTGLQTRTQPLPGRNINFGGYRG